nr:MarR family transcriptional regulator [Nakamurella flavida]
MTNRIARTQGRNTTDVTALELLDMLGPMSPGELADHLGIRTASATLLVDRLESSGVVRREVHPTDRRRVLVHLEAAGRAESFHFWVPVITAMDAAARSLPADEQSVVRGYLQALSSVMQRQPRDAPDVVPHPDVAHPDDATGADRSPPPSV